MKDRRMSSDTPASTDRNPIHPRPQLTRTNWIDLNGRWQVAFGEDGFLDSSGGTTEAQQSIEVPFPPESALSGIGEDGHTTIWYRRLWHVARPASDRRMLLHFDGIDHTADVWINGEHVAQHEGGQTGFHVDITDVLAHDGPQTITVRARDSTSLEQPRGKQDWEAEPHVIWYRRTSGIWRPVWAEIVGEVRFDSLAWTPGVLPGSLSFDARIAGTHSSQSTEVEFAFRIPDGAMVRATASVIEGRATGSVSLDDPRLDAEPDRLLWSPERPTLIEIEAAVRADGTVVDEVRSYAGLRTVGTDGTAFLLNGRPYFQRLVLEQGFWPKSHLTPPSDEALRHEVELIKQLGFNGLRMHQVTPDPKFLYWCDRLGLLVWEDAAAAYRYSELALSRTTTEWMRIVERDRSHPSVVAWVAFNESWGVPDLEVSATQRHAVAGLYHLIKALDPSRLVIGNDGWEFVAGDLLGVHDYSQDARVLGTRYGSRDATAATVRSGRPGGRRLVAGAGNPAPSVPVVLSEFGGATLSDGDTWEGYGAVRDEQALVERIRDLVGSLTAEGLAGYCYTQLTDTLQEANGLLTEARTPKADIAALRQIFGGLGRSDG